MVGEEFYRFTDWHLKDFVDVLAFPSHFQALSCVALTVAHITCDPNIWEEVHFEFY
jgi:hypothetical protein